MALFELRPVAKPQHKRNKPTAKQRGAIGTAATKKLYSRSGGVCERCKNARGQQRAHTIRRWKVEVRTTAEDLAHLCYECHTYCDKTADGRLFLSNFRYQKYLEAGRIEEYYE